MINRKMSIEEVVKKHPETDSDLRKARVGMPWLPGSPLREHRTGRRGARHRRGCAHRGPEQGNRRQPARAPATGE